ncbi:MAG: hypothetical protein A2Z34_05490 [Planctomycetes bacterium RBG_16_59_8]|nr:MAG: hypothetical protein A2Z34_05490 [Planctomycetes bacterium RBG_16_59_8]
MKTGMMWSIVALLVLSIGACSEVQEQPEQPVAAPEGAGVVTEHHPSTDIPSALQREHADLYVRLVAATQEPGAVGEAAKPLAALLHSHFEKEEAVALPPLKSLWAITAGKEVADSEKIIAMSAKLREELPSLIEEHRAITRALKGLLSAAVQDRKAETISFVDAMFHHVKTEEQVLYPASILVGDYLKLKSTPPPPPVEAPKEEAAPKTEGEQPAEKKE